VEEREREAGICLKLLNSQNLANGARLSPSTLLILSGDLNIFKNEELEYLTARGLKDSITTSNMEANVESEKSATIGLTFCPPRNSSPQLKPRRSDFVLYEGNGWKCVKHIHFGQHPVLDAEGNTIHCSTGLQGCLYPSDHIAVGAQFETSTEMEDIISHPTSKRVQ
jgi:hypothetical protein